MLTYKVKKTKKNTCLNHRVRESLDVSGEVQVNQSEPCKQESFGLKGLWFAGQSCSKLQVSHNHYNSIYSVLRNCQLSEVNFHLLLLLLLRKPSWFPGVCIYILLTNLAAALLLVAYLTHKNRLQQTQMWRLRLFQTPTPT